MEKCLYNESGTCTLDKDNAMCCLCGPGEKKCDRFVSLKFMRAWTAGVVDAISDMLRLPLSERSEQNK